MSRTTGGTLAERFVALMADDVRAHPEAYKARVVTDPEGHARKLIDGMNDDEVRWMLRGLQAEISKIKKLTNQ